MAYCLADATVGGNVQTAKSVSATLIAMALFHGMPHERVTLVKTDGRRFENLPAIVQSNMIFTEDPKIPIEDGDRFERVLPSGIQESFTVLDAGFQQGFGRAMPSHYQSKVRKSTAAAPAPSQQHNVYNLVGENSRVNIQSSDSSTNVVNVQSSQLFADIRQTIERSSLDAEVIRQIGERLDAMEAAAGTKTFAQRYGEFIALAANHVTLMTGLTPYLSALAQLLT